MPVAPTARCAACRIPIGRGHFKIDREFVFHPGCIDRPVLAETELASARAVAAQGASVITDLSTKRSELRTRMEKAEADARTTRLAYNSVADELAALRARNEDLERELAAARTETAKPTSPPTPAPTADLADDSATRFTLLELK